MTDTISFRQVGREVQGKLHRGPNFDAFSKASQPSIPTKSEQVLSVVEKRGGFGSSTDRFNYRPTVSLPGPADYVSGGKSNPSHSKRGYGGLTSNQTRFQKRQFSTAVPGPGNYSVSSQNRRGAVKYVDSRTRSLAVKTAMPAPGDYDPKPVEGKLPVASVFKSTVRKLSGPKNDNPAPWQYETNTAQKASVGPSAVFKQPTNSRRYQINLYDPHAEMYQEIVPGPGEYDVNNRNKDKKPSHMFNVDDTDRFGRPKRTKKTISAPPGPGAYTINKENTAAPVSGAVFMSESERAWIIADRKPPGPAFYKPMPIPKKKSFHLNTNNNWM